MANFVYIKNNEIVEYHDLLPESWQHISGLRQLEGNEEILNSLGWYTVNKVPPIYDPSTQYIENYTYTFENNIVNEIPVIVDADAPNTSILDLQFEMQMTNVRNTRDQKLSECDWTQLADVQIIHDDDWKQNWANYRQELRDIPNKCISGELNIFSLNWPSIPQ